MRPERAARLVVGLLLLLLVIAPLFTSGVDLLVDWLWFGQEGFRSVYLTILKSQITLSSLAGIGFMAVAGLNLLVARKLAGRHAFRVHGETVELPMLDQFRVVLRWVIWGGTVLVGYLVGDWGASHWLDYQLAQHAIPMGESDPLFGIDLSFYLFRLPFQWFLYHWALVTLILCLLGAVFLYLVEGGIWVTPRGPAVGRYARAHFCALGRSEEHTSELQSHVNLVCRLLLEKTKTKSKASTFGFVFVAGGALWLTLHVN